MQVGGARPGRSTTANVEAVVHDAQQTMQKSQCSTIALYDLEDAYNRVNIQKLVEKLQKLNVSDSLVRWIVALLGTRRCQMRFGSWRSEKFEVSSGLPQGSPLSAILFNIYTHDIIEAIQEEDTKLYTYVDDILVHTVDSTPVGAAAKQQQASSKLAQWVNDNDQSIQSDKSMWMLATRAHVDRRQFTLTYNGGVVPQEDEVVYLGIMMDRNMTMAQHLQRLRDKAQKGLKVLKYAARQRVTQRSLVNLMRATVQSRIEYGLHVASSTAKTAQLRLEQVQNEAMRIVTGAAKPTSCDSLRYWLGIRKVKYQQRYQATREYLRAVASPSHPLRIALEAREDTMVTQRLKTVRSWVLMARDLVEEVCPTENIIVNEWVTNKKGIITTERIGNRSWRDRAAVINEACVREWLEEVEPTVIIATDGSIRDEVTAWGGAVWRGGNICFEWSTAREGRASSYRSEREAFGDALAWMAAHTNVRDKVVILTDSLSMVSKLEMGLVLETWAVLLRSIDAQVIVTYIPGHCGISYNEKADQLAGEAVVFGELRREPDDVRCEMERRIRQEEGREQSEYWSTLRLQERGWRQGSGTKVLMRGWERGRYTQMETSVLMKSTLR